MASSYSSVVDKEVADAVQALLRAMAKVSREAAPSPTALLISQRNCLQVIGLPPRSYLEILRAPGFPLHVTRAGKLRLVDAEAFVEHLRAVSPAAPAQDEPDGTETLRALLPSTTLIEPKRRRSA